MSTTQRDDELAWEQAVNKRYLKQADTAAEDSSRGWDKVAAPSSTGWTGSGPKKPIPKSPARPLRGRVALTTDDGDLGRDFYVGSGFTPLEDGITVVSWAAPVARLLFEGRHETASSPEGIDPGAVTACRTFSARGQRLVDFEDECRPGADPETAFSRPSRLTIPPPPGTSDSSHIRPPTTPGRERAQSADRTTKRDRLTQPHGRTVAGSGVSGAGPSQSAASRSSATEEGIPAGQPRPRSEGQERRSPRTDATSTQHLRAERLLREALDAPKTGTLASVLSTLQPEQYRLVTWQSEKNLVVQGHPGTGKTIVAAHRAAFLVLPKDRDGEVPRLHQVALLGPTDRWKAHIEPTVSELVDEGVGVLSLESLVREWAGGLPRSLHPTSERELHSRWAIGRVVEQIARDQGSRLRQMKRAARIRELVNTVVQDTESHREFVPREGADLSEWLLAAGDHGQAKRDSSYLLFLAAAGIVASGVGHHSGYQHIVVDEAQDIRPIEWWMLSKMFRPGAEARWSLFGDMYQRRSDSTWGSWEQLIDRLELADTDTPTLEPEVLNSGYRSTREILRYAGALLPRGQRTSNALRSGPEPSIHQVGPKRVTEDAVQAADRLAVRYDQGSVAVIAWGQSSCHQIERALRRQGWRGDPHDAGRFQEPNHGARVAVISPVEARGLEFDAVVVVEPGDFKPSLGRHGELYTSLTRANNELVIIHSKAMPKELRGRGNRVR